MKLIDNFLQNHINWTIFCFWQLIHFLSREWSSNLSHKIELWEGQDGWTFSYAMQRERDVSRYFSPLNMVFFILKKYHLRKNNFKIYHISTEKNFWVFYLVDTSTYSRGFPLMKNFFSKKKEKRKGNHKA